MIRDDHSTGSLTVQELTHLRVAEVPGVAEDLGRHVVLGHDVDNQLMILEEPISEHLHPPQILIPVP